MRRIFERKRVWGLDRATCEAGCSLLAAAVSRRFAPFDVVVAVLRGGREPATLVARSLRICTVAVRARHNPTDAVRSAATGRVELEIPEFERLPERSRLLVVDDVCGTGATLEAVRGLLRTHLRPRGLRTAVLCRNAGSMFRPDLWIWDVRDWVAFPWEAPPDEAAEPLPLPTFVRFGR